MLEIKKEAYPIQVILIENSKIPRLGLKQSLNSDEEIIVVSELEGTQEALSIVKKLKPEVVLIDLFLPETNGIDLGQQIKTVLPETKTIILSTEKESNDVIGAFASGIDGYCNKCIDIKSLITIIKNIAKGVCWVDPIFSTKEKYSALGQRNEFNLIQIKEKNKEINLTQDENLVLNFLIQGKNEYEISLELSLTIKKIKNIIYSIFQKIDVENRVQYRANLIKNKLA